MVIDEFVVSIGATTSAFESAIGKLNSQIGTLNVTGAKIGVGIAAASAVAAAGLVALTKKAIDYQESIYAASKATGASAESLSVLAYAGRQTGNSLEDISGSLAKVSLRAKSAAEGSKESAAAFGKFGIKVIDVNGNVKSSTTLFGEMSERMRDTSKTAITTGDVMAVMGRGASKNMDLLGQDFKQAAREAAAFGVVVKQDAADKADEFADALQKLKEPLLGVGLFIANDVIPWMLKFSNAFVDVSENTGAFKATAAVAVVAFKSIASAAIIVVTGLYQVGETFVTVFESLGLAIRGEFSQAIDRMNSGFDDVSATGSKATSQIADMWKETDDATDASNRLSPAIRNTTTELNYSSIANEAAADAAKLTASANAEIETSVEGQREAMIALYRQAYPESMQTVEEWAILQAQEAQNYLATKESAEAYGERMAALAREIYPEATQTAEEYGNAMAELSRQQLKTASEAPGIAQIYKDTATSITGAFRDTFRDVFDNGVSSFKSLGKRIADVFKTVLADMAVLAITQPIIVPVVQAVGGALGLSGATIGGVVGQLGGGGGGNTTGIGAVIGGVVSAAIPYIAAALAINAVSGGMLFGTKFKQTSAGSRFSVQNGELSGYSYRTEEKQKAFFGGTVTRSETNPVSKKILDEMNDGFSDLDEILSKTIKSLGIFNSKTRVAQYNSVQQSIDVSGSSPEQAAERVQAWLDEMAAQKIRNVLVESKFRGLINQFTRAEMEQRQVSRDGETSGENGEYYRVSTVMTVDAEKTTAMGRALLSLGSLLDRRPVDDYAEAVKNAGMTLLEQRTKQKSSLLSIVSAYDGSISATQRLLAATADRYELEMQYLAQIDSVRKTMTTSFEGTIENFKKSKMAPDELYDYILSKIAGDRAALTGATDPEKINEIMSRINASANEAFNIQSDDKNARADALTAILQSVLATGTAKLDAAKSLATTQFDGLVEIVEYKMGRVADVMERAANLQLEAAKRYVQAEAQQLSDDDREGWGRSTVDYSSVALEYHDSGIVYSQIPKMASGGIVDSATVALIGEGRGPEAVIPLDRLGEFIGGSKGGDQTIIINLDGRQIAKVTAQHFPAILRANGVAV